MSDPIHTDLQLTLIQSVRALHALAEAGFRVRVQPGDWDKVKGLAQRFKIPLEPSDERAPLLHIGIDHKGPETRVGRLTRPLIFPHGIVDYCRSLWSDRRDIEYCFPGLISPERKTALEEWIRHSLGQEPPDLPLSRDPNKPGRLRRILSRFTTRQEAQLRRHGRVWVWSSLRGRRFPGKAWDEEYQRLLGSSTFVLCPSGDFVWTYRFFEAILCGAIPIVEESCPAYEGFEYFSMDDLSDQHAWTPETAEHNYALCRERITVSVPELRAEIEGLVDGSLKT